MTLPKFLQLLPVPVMRGPARGCWWTLYPYTSYWRLGGHEPRMDAALRIFGDLRGKVAWDCGAHYGIYTLRFARQVGPTGQVVAFEPDPVSFERLDRHVRMNRFAHVVALNAAASDTSEDATMVVTGKLGATTSHLPYPGEQVTAQTLTQTIKRVRADELLAAGRIQAPDLIKLDVEGHGGEVLRGARACLEQTHPVILAAMHSPQEVAAIRSVLEPMGYGIESVGASASMPIPWDACELGGPYILRRPA